MKRVVLVLAVVLIMASTVQASTVNLEWKPSPAADVAGYKLYRADAACSIATTFKAVKTIQATFWGDVVTQRGTYCYRVTAYDVAGNESVPSSTVEVKILLDDPPGSLAVHSIVP